MNELGKDKKEFKITLNQNYITNEDLLRLQVKILEIKEIENGFEYKVIPINNKKAITK